MRNELTGAGLVVIACGLLLLRALRTKKLPRNRAAHMRRRLRLRMRPGYGHATIGELWLRWGRFASFRRSARSRRSVGFWARVRHPRWHSVLLGRAQYRHALRLPLEEHVVIMAPPRTGKTGLLAAVILHYPGPVLSTTTKADVCGLTAGVRALRGPVHVFNPQAIGDVPSTFRWNPLDGCNDQQTCIRRADGFANAVAVDGTEDSSFWSAKASSYLRALFYAAALAGGDMRLVVRWALGSAEDAESILLSQGAVQWALELGELRGEAQKTAATVRMVLSRALSFMTDPALAAAVMPCAGEPFSMEDFLRDRGTLYLIADSENEASPLAPLFAAFAGEVHWTAVQAGQASPGGRLDPPLCMALDEVTQVCPVPLPSWCADSGGKGIQLMTVAHGEAQLEGRWKKHGARAILDTAGCMILLPGIKDTATLTAASQLCGQAAWKEHGQEHASRHDVLPPDLIRSLLPGRGLFLRGGYAPVIGKLQRAWKDPVYRKAKRHGYALAALAAAPAPLALDEPDHLAIAQAARARVVDGQHAEDDEDGREFLPAAGATGAAYPWAAR